MYLSVTAKKVRRSFFYTHLGFKWADYIPWRGLRSSHHQNRDILIMTHLMSSSRDLGSMNYLFIAITQSHSGP